MRKDPEESTMFEKQCYNKLLEGELFMAKTSKLWFQGFFLNKCSKITDFSHMAFV